MQIPLKPRDVGELIGVTIKVSMAHFLSLFMIMLVVNLPSLFLQFWLEEQAADPNPEVGPLVTASILGMIVPMVLQSLAAAVATVIVAGSFTGDRKSLGEAINIAFRRFLPLLLFTLLLGLVTGLGFLLLIIPGIYLMVRFYVGSCAVVLDNCGVGEAFGRSSNLTEGRRWAILGFAILIGLVIIIPTAVVAAVAGAGVAGIGGVVVSYIGGVIFAVVGVTAPVVMYFDLRVRNESFDIEQLASLVDRIGGDAD